MDGYIKNSGVLKFSTVWEILDNTHKYIRKTITVYKKHEYSGFIFLSTNVL
jgi:hypothetical protein